MLSHSGSSSLHVDLTREPGFTINWKELRVLYWIPRERQHFDPLETLPSVTLQRSLHLNINSTHLRTFVCQVQQERWEGKWTFHDRSLWECLLLHSRSNFSTTVWGTRSQDQRIKHFIPTVPVNSQILSRLCIIYEFTSSSLASSSSSVS